MSVLFPEPETPLMQTSRPSGIEALILRRLFSAAPLISMDPIDFGRDLSLFENPDSAPVRKGPDSESIEMIIVNTPL